MTGATIRAPADVVQALPVLYRVVFAVLVRSGKAEVMGESNPRPGEA